MAVLVDQIETPVVFHVRLIPGHRNTHRHGDVLGSWPDDAKTAAEDEQLAVGHLHGIGHEHDRLERGRVELEVGLIHAVDLTGSADELREQPMTTAAVLLAAGGGSRFSGAEHKLRADLAGSPSFGGRSTPCSVRSSTSTSVVVVRTPMTTSLAATSRLCQARSGPRARPTRCRWRLNMPRLEEHDAIVVGMADQPLVASAAWSRVSSATATTVCHGRFRRRTATTGRLAASTWSELPTSGDAGARSLIAANPDLVTLVSVPGDPAMSIPSARSRKCGKR